MTKSKPAVAKVENKKANAVRVLEQCRVLLEDMLIVLDAAENDVARSDAFTSYRTDIVTQLEAIVKAKGGA